MRLGCWPLLIVAACAPAADEPPLEDDLQVAQAPSRLPRPTYSGPAYFPASLGKPTVRCPWEPARLQPVLTDFERDWYSRQLAAAGESSLYLASQAPRSASAATLRFTWLRSFHAPVVIRIETNGPDLPRLVAKQLSGAGGYDPGKVAKTVDRTLSPVEARRLGAVLKRTKVFEIPADPCGGGCDGAQWIFESAQGQSYRFLSLWSPRKGPARELGRFLTGLTGWDYGMVY